jgi:low temperature requirement protein LtrA
MTEANIGERGRGIRPPTLRTGEDASASRLELFFDLAYVLVVLELANAFYKDLSWRGFLVFVALYIAMWFSWVGFTLYANRFDTDDTVFRLLALAGMGGVVAMAASVEGVAGSTGRWFALGYTIVRLVLVAGYLRAWWHVPDARLTIRPYLFGHASGAVIWLVSAAVPTPARYGLWAAGIAVDLIGPALAARQRKGVALHVEHLPERFGLFVILVLGESVAAVVTGLHDGGWKPVVLLAAGLAFVLAAAMWWVYFDLAGGAAKRRVVEEGGEGTRQGVHDFYVYAHLPLTVFLAAVAVGLEHAVVHGGDDHLGASTRWLLGIGLAGYLAAAALIQSVLSRQTVTALLWPGVGVALVLAVAAVNPSPPLTLGLFVAIVVLGVVAGIIQRRAGQLRTAKV